MYFLVKYKGEIKVNQVGFNYEFPHYSTVLGAVLSVYHKYKNTPRYPRKDMYELADELNLKLSILIPENNSNKLLMEYSQSRNMEKKIKNIELMSPYSPSFKHIMKGEYYILGYSENEDLIKSITKYPLKLGSNDGVIVNYELEFYNNIESFIKKYDQKLYFLKDKENYKFESNYPKDCIELCLVSQIEKPRKKLMGQGIYSEFELELLDEMFNLEMISYKKIKNLLDNDLTLYIERINNSVKEVFE